MIQLLRQNLMNKLLIKTSVNSNTSTCRHLYSNYTKIHKLVFASPVQFKFGKGIILFYRQTTYLVYGNCFI